MITTFYPPYHFGGDGVYVEQLSNELAARGHHVTVIYDKDAYRLLARREPQAQITEHPNLSLHGLESRAGWLSPLVTQQTGIPFFHRQELRSILAQGFDVIHYHNISLVGGPQILEYGNALKLYTLHEFWLVCPMHILFRDNQEVCDKPHCMSCTLHYRRPPQWWRYTNVITDTVRNVDMFLAPSCFSVQAHRERGFAAPMMHLPNFAQQAQPTPLSRELATYLDLPYFMYAGRLEKLKGVHTLLPHFCRESGTRLLIVGRGSFENELRALAGDNLNIVFLGPRERGEVQTLMQQAIALLVPSLCYEMFPLVMIEAFQQGTPVIARDIGSLPEIIRSSGGGIIYQSERELDSALLQLRDRTQRQKFGAQGSEAYQREYTPEVHLARYLELIENLRHRKEPRG